MRNGFIINFDLCVNCKACIAACLLENEWSVSARNILSYNSEFLPGIPVTHLSLACNHCEKPLCLVGCPASAYSRDSLTSAVIIDSEKCIGCNYCLWNCPYDAPKPDLKKGFIEKCNFCNLRILEGVEPACTAACPTGSLRFGQIPEVTEDIVLSWIPERDINPAIKIIGSKNQIPLKIIPDAGMNDQISIPVNDKNISGEWSLILFTFLIAISVSFNISNMLGGYSIKTTPAVSLLVLAAICSILHLRKKLKAWKAIVNVKSSPLSREIVLFLVYSILVITALIIDSNTMLLVSVIIGLLLLMAIDYVYTFANRSIFMMVHSGQTFLTGLLISSYLLNSLFPFIFIASIKIIFNLFYMVSNRQAEMNFNLRRIRIAVLLIISTSMISGLAVQDMAKLIIFLSGEFADRVLYYKDFNPVNINDEMTNHLILSQNEKKGDQ